MWTQVYAPVAGSIPLSALFAALPIFVLAYLLAVRRLPSYLAALASLAVAILVALLVYGAPLGIVLSAAVMGAAFGLFPIVWIVINALFVYNLAVMTGRLEVIRDSVAVLSSDRRVQGLLVAFCFGALMESIAGFGTPIALGGAMLVGLGFAAEEALFLTLLANTTAVAFGNLGIPVISLAGVVGPLLGVPLGPLQPVLATAVARLIFPLSLLIPSIMLIAFSGWRGLREAWPAALAIGVAFSVVQLAVASLIGPSLAGVLASLASFLALFVLLRFWNPRPLQPTEAAALEVHLAEVTEEAGQPVAEEEVAPELPEPVSLSFWVVLDAWSPFLLLVAVVIVGSVPPLGPVLDSLTAHFAWPALDGLVLRAPPLVTPEQAGTPAAVYPAIYTFDWLKAAGTLTLISAAILVILTGVSLRRAAALYWHTIEGLQRAIIAVVGFLALAWVMNYGALTATLGLFFTFTGALFPFFSAVIGWLGVFLTGSDTASNNLFGGLQVTTASQVGTPPVLSAAANSGGGVSGKLISPQNLSIGAVAVERPGIEGPMLKRTTPWSLALMAAVGVLAMIQAYLLPGTIPPLP